MSLANQIYHQAMQNQKWESSEREAAEIRSAVTQILEIYVIEKRRRPVSPAMTEEAIELVETENNEAQEQSPEGNYPVSPNIFYYS